MPVNPGSFVSPYGCHEPKTIKDQGRIAKAKRQAAKHTGAFRTKRPMLGSRASPLKKHMDGGVSRRQT